MYNNIFSATAIKSRKIEKDHKKEDSKMKSLHLGL